MFVKLQRNMMSKVPYKLAKPLCSNGPHVWNNVLFRTFPYISILFRWFESKLCLALTQISKNATAPKAPEPLQHTDTTMPSSGSRWHPGAAISNSPNMSVFPATNGCRTKKKSGATTIRNLVRESHGSAKRKRTRPCENSASRCRMSHLPAAKAGELKK